MVVPRALFPPLQSYEPETLYFPAATRKTLVRMGIFDPRACSQRNRTNAVARGVSHV